jgi:DNA replication and repair protein RecF
MAIQPLHGVMAGHSRSKNGVALLAYVPAIHAFLCCQDVDARHKAGHDGANIASERDDG